MSGALGMYGVLSKVRSKFAANLFNNIFHRSIIPHAHEKKNHRSSTFWRTLRRTRGLSLLRTVNNEHTG